LKEFKINKYLELKLLQADILDTYTQIFVNNESFFQCAYILINNPQNHKDQFEINSIDEAAEKLDSQLEELFEQPSLVPPEALFWAHCSNLQAWAESGYDTRILHSNLAFPLLKKLCEAGDPKAKKVFNEEIAKRILSQYPPVIIFLLEGGYLDYLSNSELEFVSGELIRQINMPHSKLIDVNFAKSLIKTSRKYLEKGSNHIKMLLQVYSVLNRFILATYDSNNKLK